MKMKRSKRFIIGMGGLSVILVALFIASSSVSAGMSEGSHSKPIWSGYPPLGPLAQEDLNKAEVELGRKLFFDNRYTGDASDSCATCHVPEKGFGDGKQLSNGYPGTAHFRNAPSLINANRQREQMWMGSNNACDTTSRTHMTSQLFMNADGRYIEERTRQIPEYYAEFQKLFGIDRTIYFGKIQRVICKFVSSLTSNPKSNAFDRFMNGDGSCRITPNCRPILLARSDCVMSK